jgi:predicted dinucleotide-binding enzyme
MRLTRRRFLGIAAGASLIGLPAFAAEPRLKIGVIGSGRLGGTVGGLWVKAGHQVMFSGLDLEEVKKFAAGLGPNALAGTPRDAARFGDVVLTAVPYSALPQVGKDVGADLKGKIVLDASNPVPARDGEVGVAARAKGTGVASAEYLPGVRLVRAFNAVGFGILQKEAHRAGERIAIPLAADDKGALDIAVRLVEEAGFEPVVVGGLARAKEFDAGTPMYGKGYTARELRKGLGLGS